MDQKWKRLESGQFTSSLILGPYLPGWEAGKCNMYRKKRKQFWWPALVYISLRKMLSNRAWVRPWKQPRLM